MSVQVAAEAKQLKKAALANATARDGAASNAAAAARAARKDASDACQRAWKAAKHAVESNKAWTKARLDAIGTIVCARRVARSWRKGFKLRLKAARRKAVADAELVASRGADAARLKVAPLRDAVHRLKQRVD